MINIILLLHRPLRDPADQHLGWHGSPESVLVVKKDMDENVTDKFKAVIQWLVTVISQVTNKIKHFIDFLQ